MCGIGGCTVGSKVYPEFERNFKRFSSRGPDSTQYKTVKNFKFGHHRLAIIDLDDRSNQPMTIGNWTICFNGEIYNYEELKNKFLNDVNFHTVGDTEVLLNLWIKFGEKSLRYLKGMWAFSIYNALTNELYLVRDSFGIKPLYYFLDKKEMLA